MAYWERELGKKIGENELESLNWNDYQASLNISGADYLGAVEEIQRFSRKIACWYNEGGYDLLFDPDYENSPVETRLL